MFYSLSSLALGAAAWVLGTARLVRRRGAGLSTLSWGACTVALYVQLAMIKDLMDRHGGWGTLEDIDGGILFGATVMVAVTVVLHLAALWRERGRRDAGGT